MNQERLQNLLSDLVKLPSETEWLEFKENNDNPFEIGENISSISNSAALLSIDPGYIVWGVKDTNNEIIGTTFIPKNTKKGNEELENWLSISLEPHIDFRIHEFTYEGKNIVLFQIPPASTMPTRFKGIEYIRLGSLKKKLRDHPEKEKSLWKQFSSLSFETETAAYSQSADDVLSKIDYPSYFESTDQPLPDNKSGIINRLAYEKIINREGENSYNITNLGAILYAKDFSFFGNLSRKAIRVIIYEGNNRTKTLIERQGALGYAIGFNAMIDFITSQLPRNEVIENALRREVSMYPDIAIRELVANALIHQDFTITGTGPMVEIFFDRIEITNPGIPLIDTDRFIDAPPRSRNDSLATFMRRLNICEERGSGIDKVIKSVERFQLPAPDFKIINQNIIAILYAYKELRKLSKKDRTRACYQHACLQYVSNEQMTNSTLRKRFSIKDENSSIASRIIAATIQAGLIKPSDPESTSRKHMKYVPIWA